MIKLLDIWKSFCIRNTVLLVKVSANQAVVTEPRVQFNIKHVMFAQFKLGNGLAASFVHAFLSELLAGTGQFWMCGTRPALCVRCYLRKSPYQ